jgi:hypothetical protein
VECDPAIVTLPRVSAAPLPDPASRLPDDAARVPSIAPGAAPVSAGWPAQHRPSEHVPLPPGPPPRPGDR